LKKIVREIGRKPFAKRRRQAVEAMTHAINNWIRVEILAIFHEGEFSAGEIAEEINVDVKTVTGHIHDLYESGCIEFAGAKLVGSTARPVYRALALPKVDQEIYRGMSVADRHDLNGAITQGILTETVSAYGKGKMDADEQLYLVWDAPTLDDLGEEEMHAHLEASYAGAKEIQTRAANRLAKSGKKGITKVIGFLAFRRGRPGRPAGGYFKSADDEQ
jgi:hypothetical protein